MVNINKDILEALDLKVNNSKDTLWLFLRKRYIATGKGCGLLSDGSLYFDLKFVKVQ